MKKTKNTTINRNLLVIREKNSLNQQEMADKLGAKRTTYVGWESGGVGLPVEIAKKIVEKFGVSYDDLFSDDTVQNITQVQETKTERKSVKPKSNAQAIEISEDHILIPLVGVRAQAGYLRGFNDPEFMENLPKIAVDKQYDRGGHFQAFENSGDSMNDGKEETAILDRDILVTRELSKTHWMNKISDEHPFVIVHEDGVLCKQILKHDVEKGIITCHSRNPAPLPEYEDFDLKLSEVKQLFYVREVRRNKKIKY